MYFKCPLSCFELSFSNLRLCVWVYMSVCIFVHVMSYELFKCENLIYSYQIFINFLWSSQSLFWFLRSDINIKPGISLFTKG